MEKVSKSSPGMQYPGPIGQITGNFSRKVPLLPTPSQFKPPFRPKTQYVIPSYGQGYSSAVKQGARPQGQYPTYQTHPQKTSSFIPPSSSGMGSMSGANPHAGAMAAPSPTSSPQGGQFKTPPTLSVAVSFSTSAAAPSSQSGASFASAESLSSPAGGPTSKTGPTLSTAGTFSPSAGTLASSAVPYRQRTSKGALSGSFEHWLTRRRQQNQRQRKWPSTEERKEFVRKLEKYPLCFYSRPQMYFENCNYATNCMFGPNQTLPMLPKYWLLENGGYPPRGHAPPYQPRNRGRFQQRGRSGYPAHRPRSQMPQNQIGTAGNKGHSLREHFPHFSPTYYPLVRVKWADSNLKGGHV